jgi:hypothetical protein
MKHLYTTSLLIILSLLCRPSPGRAQQGGEGEIKDRIRAAEIAYLSQKLDLTPDEAQKFWPLYNQYTREVEVLIAERRNRTAPTERKEIQKQAIAGDNELKYDQRMLDIKTHYNREFQKVLPATKAGSVFRSEREFRNQLIRTYKERQVRNVGGAGARRFRQ